MTFKTIPVFSFLGFLVAVALFCFVNFLEEKAKPPDPKTFLPSQLSEHFEPAPATKITFVGDIMLDRGVEYMMKKETAFYPFEKINKFFSNFEIVFGNLECPIVETPTNFSDASLKFACASSTTEALSFANFNLLSLANNHTTNMGKKGLEETKDFLSKANINFVGDPIGCNEDFLFQKDKIIFLAFNKTFPFNCSDEEIATTVEAVKASNPQSFLIVSMHWGEEYQKKSSVAQQKLAEQLIEAGADLIIGSHPHVVQEIELYPVRNALSNGASQGKLIFYSLGNFIFDQSFSKATQQGLALGLEISPEKLLYRLFPIQINKGQPSLMEEKEAKNFLEQLAQKSSPELAEKIKNGIIEIADQKVN